MRWPRPQPKLSIVVAFYNMRREAPRTLFSLTARYQRDVAEHEYEVLAIDSGSSEPLDPRMVENLQANFRYHFVKPGSPTPCRAMNFGIERARGKWVACAIDGARILSPGMLHQSLRALRHLPDAFVYSLGLHLGPKLQRESALEGYCQSVEDRLLAESGWEEDGYRLFGISALAGSSRGGYFGRLAESNFFALRRDRLAALGGFDERFKAPGGGLVNPDLFNRATALPDVQPVMLLGEASFHQFHGGVSTNAAPGRNPIDFFKQEYREIRGRPYQVPSRRPLYMGRMPAAALRFARSS